MHEHCHRQERSERLCKSNPFNRTTSAFPEHLRKIIEGYLKGNAGEGKYVTFCRPLELSASVKKFRSHPFWGAHSDSRIRHRHVSKISKSKVSNFCFSVTADKYVRLDKHFANAREDVGGNGSPLSNRRGTSLASVSVEFPLQSEATIQWFEPP